LDEALAAARRVANGEIRRRRRRNPLQRHQRPPQRRSVVITANLAFSQWPTVFGGDEKLAAALLDRLAETAAIITTRGKRFRTRKRLADAATQQLSGYATYCERVRWRLTPFAW